MWYEGCIVGLTVLVLLFLKWFLEPYSVYKRRAMVKELEIVEDGVAIEMPGQPYLLSQKSEQFDLSLVVPAYNEEERIGSMLE